MDEVQAKRLTVVITKRGKPVAKLVPADQEQDNIYHFLAGKGEITGDVIAPVLSPEEWGELKCRGVMGFPERRQTQRIEPEGLLYIDFKPCVCDLAADFRLSKLPVPCLMFAP